MRGTGADWSVVARSAYEVSKLPSETAQQKLAAEAAEAKLTLAQTKAAVTQRKGKPSPKKRGFKQTFFAENDIRIVVSAPRKITYEEVEVAIDQAREEVRHYLDQGRSAS